jgi:hypothetical protein
MARVQQVVGDDSVQTLTLPYATQRRIVLEAVAFGSFLRWGPVTKVTES